LCSAGIIGCISCLVIFTVLFNNAAVCHGISVDVLNTAIAANDDDNEFQPVLKKSYSALGCGQYLLHFVD